MYYGKDVFVCESKSGVLVIVYEFKTNFSSF